MYLFILIIIVVDIFFNAAGIDEIFINYCW